ncbi:MAG: TolC family protein, partial [Bacteroidetes bacterium]|nr:TolC family protein [Bacteroidota bacterium]
QFQTKNRIAQAKITALDAKLALDAEKITLRQEIQQSYTDARNAWSKYLASEDAVNSIQQSFDFTKEKFDAGLATSVEYSVSTSQLIKTRSQLLQAKYEYILRLKILDFYQGNPITL